MNDGVDDTLCGCINAFISLFYLVLYIIILKVVYTRKDRFNMPVYKQLFNMGINDCLQLSMHFVGGICVIFQIDMPNELNKVFGAFLTTAWSTWVAFSFSISMNRLMTFCFQHYCMDVYSKRNLRLQIAFCWFVMFTPLVLYLSPLCAVRFNRLNFGWSYDRTLSMVNVFKMADLVWTAVMMATSFINYGLIYLKMKVMKIKSSSIKNGNQEVRVCIQAVCLCVYTTAVELHWYFKSYYMPVSRWSNFLSNLLGLLNCTTNPTLCLTLNLSIQTAFIEFILGKKLRENTTVMTVTTIMPSSRPR
uniref:7TM_GPCR_Srx domain-containing protein n=1 Tax=Panagrellus redivivus TaxID=6233 RepID=A0A7E4VFR5_PANRE